MSKSMVQLSLVALGAVLVASCSMKGLEQKVASMEIQHKTLASGKPVVLDFNVSPTVAWGCRSVGQQQSYNWQLLRTQGSFELAGPTGLLTQKAMDYANTHRLHTNYINLTIPQEFTSTQTTGRLSIHSIENPGALAKVSFYHCKKINPNKQLGAIKHTDVSFSD